MVGMRGYMVLRQRSCINIEDTSPPPPSYCFARNEYAPPPPSYCRAIPHPHAAPSSLCLSLSALSNLAVKLSELFPNISPQRRVHVLFYYQVLRSKNRAHSPIPKAVVDIQRIQGPPAIATTRTESAKDNNQQENGRGWQSFLPPFGPTPPCCHC